MNRTFSIFSNNELNIVEEKLRDYAISVDGGFEKSDIDYHEPNFCSILIHKSITLITYPNNFAEYISISEQLSKSLNRTIYTFLVYGTEFWMIYIFDNEALSGIFNPFPEYWSDKKYREQIKTRNFNLGKLCKDLNLSQKLVRRYFVNWESIDRDKAYRKDEFGYRQGEQVFDLIKLLGITYSDFINYEKQGTAFKLWTSRFPFKEKINITLEDIQKTRRYSKNPIEISLDDIEVLLEVNRINFLTPSTGKCAKCGEPIKELSDIECFLLIEKFLVTATGNCKKCGQKLETTWGITKLENLIRVLDQ